MIHHIMKEEHIEKVCPYCNEDLKDKKFKIELVEGVNYKSTKCRCGKKLSFRVNKEIYNYKDGEGNLLIERIKFEDEEILKEKRKVKEK